MLQDKKVIIITGGTGGLGRELTKYFLIQNNIVVITYNSEDSFLDLKKETSNSQNLFGFNVNVIDEDNVLKFAQDVKNQFKRADVLINLVGGYHGGVKVQDLNIKDIEKQFNLNFKSAFFCIKHFLNLMIQQNKGSIINIGSKQGIKGGPRASAYAASKAALINFTISLAQELQNTNISANVIVPGIIDTPANRISMPNEDYSSWVTADEIGNIINTIAFSESKVDLDVIISLFGDN